MSSVKKSTSILRTLHIWSKIVVFVYCTNVWCSCSPVCQAFYIVRLSLMYWFFNYDFFHLSVVIPVFTNIYLCSLFFYLLYSFFAVVVPRGRMRFLLLCVVVLIAVASGYNRQKRWIADDFYHFNYNVQIFMYYLPQKILCAETNLILFEANWQNINSAETTELWQFA